MSVRRVMRLLLSGRRPGGERPASIRPLQAGDEAALAQLMLDAYRGTTDDGGESYDDALREVRATLGGAHGELLWVASLVEPARGGGLLSAAVVTRWRGTLLLAFLMTEPAQKRRGRARRLLEATLDALAASGHPELMLIVTAGNTPAVALYEQLGFTDASAPPPEPA